MISIGLRVISLLLTVAIAGYAKADYAVDYVDIKCLPELEHLDIEHVVFNSDITLPPKGSLSRDEVLAQHGLLSPKELEVMCRLEQSNYTIKTTQAEPSARGMCGGAPTVRLSLARNSENLLEDVEFGGACFKKSYIKRVVVYEGRQGWGEGNIKILIGHSDRQDSMVYLSGSDVSGENISGYLRRLQ